MFATKSNVLGLPFEIDSKGVCRYLKRCKRRSRCWGSCSGSQPHLDIFCSTFTKEWTELWAIHVQAQSINISGMFVQDSRNDDGRTTLNFVHVDSQLPGLALLVKQSRRTYNKGIVFWSAPYIHADCKSSGLDKDWTTIRSTGLPRPGFSNCRATHNAVMIPISLYPFSFRRRSIFAVFSTTVRISASEAA